MSQTILALRKLVWAQENTSHFPLIYNSSVPLPDFDEAGKTSRWLTCSCVKSHGIFFIAFSKFKLESKWWRSDDGSMVQFPNSLYGLCLFSHCVLGFLLWTLAFSSYIKNAGLEYQ